MVRQTLKFAACLLALIVLAACSSPPSEPVDAAPTPADQPAVAQPRQPTVLDDQLKAIDKAKSVEETLKKGQADRDKQMDEESGG